MKFKNVENKELENNLILIESNLPEILSEILIESYHTNTTSLKQIVESIEISNPLNFNKSHGHKHYQYKIRSFLNAVYTTDLFLDLKSGINLNEVEVNCNDDNPTKRKNEIIDYLYNNIDIVKHNNSIEKTQLENDYTLNLNLELKLN